MVLLRRIPETEQTRFKACLVAAAKAFIKAIMLGKKKWSALVQQVGWVTHPLRYSWRFLI